MTVSASDNIISSQPRGKLPPSPRRHGVIRLKFVLWLLRIVGLSGDGGLALYWLPGCLHLKPTHDALFFEVGGWVMWVWSGGCDGGWVWL